MPLHALLTAHKITRLRLRVTQTDSMAVKRSYVPTGVLKCRVIPLTVTEREKMKRDGYTATHKLRFLFDPELSVGDRVVHIPPKGTVAKVFRVVPGRNPHELDIMWTLNAQEHSEDNQTSFPIAPYSPLNLQAVGGATVALSWTRGDGIVSSYTLFRGSASGQETEFVSNILGTSYVDTLPPIGTVYYTVVAVNAFGNSDPSNEASAIATATILPQAVTVSGGVDYWVLEGGSQVVVY